MATSEKFELHVIFGQRKESYTGEYAPEALDIADEICMEENPAYLAEKLAEHQKDESFEAVEVIRLEVDLDTIMKILRKTAPVVPATIL